MNENPFLKIFLFVSVFAVCSASVFGQSEAKAARLFSLSGAEKVGDKSLSLAAVNQRPIKVNLKAIASPQAREIEIADLDGKIYRAVQRKTEGFVQQNADTFSWNGKITAADFDGDVILTAYKNVLTGLIYTPSGVYNITPQADGAHVLVKIDQSLFPEEHPADYFDWVRENTVQNTLSTNGKIFDQPTGNQQTLAPNADDGSTIDVMIVYTTPVKNGLGGTTQADAFSAQAVTTTNTVYSNSGINPRVRLVRSMEVNFAETGTLSAALTWVRNDATVAAAREAVKADAVAIFVQNASDGCGLGYLMANGGNSTSFAPSAFTATVKGCAVDNLSFPHELGHNQGANHNPADAGTTSAQAVFTYSFGHCFNTGTTTTNFRTVMSYAGTQCGSTTTRRPYFSNPNVNYLAQPTGTTDRNNALTINNTALAFSQFRQSLAPTAANVSASGRVLDTKARGISGATVSMTGADGATRTTRTNPFGFYTFDDVKTGETYIVNAHHKRFQFTPQAVSVFEQITALNITALQ